VSTVDELAAVPLFEALSESERRELAGWFDVQTVSPGVRLAGEGAAGYSFFVILEGGAEVTEDDRVLAQLGQGDFFGEMAILGGGRRVATVTTTSPAKVLVMFGTEFRRLEQERPEIAARIEESMRSRVAENARQS